MQTYGKSHRHCSNSIRHNIAQECDNVKCTNLIFLIAPSGKYDLKKSTHSLSVLGDIEEIIHKSQTPFFVTSISKIRKIRDFAAGQVCVIPPLL
jgi:hypothetical protein